MLEDTIANIEGRIQQTSAVDEKSRAELLELLGKLRGEIATLSQTHQEQAESIAAFAQMSAQEATRSVKNPETLRHSLGGLESSVDEFEETHPKLVGIVNRISSMLTNMGI
jgi:DNA repair exonuclease SbcCD ATPase subunit